MVYILDDEIIKICFKQLYGKLVSVGKQTKKCSGRRSPEQEGEGKRVEKQFNLTLPII
jgi:hypothetical protein